MKKYGVQWHYCNTKENPADLATRGLSPQGLQASKLWLEGPAWLLKQEEWLHPVVPEPDVTAALLLDVPAVPPTEAVPCTSAEVPEEHTDDVPDQPEDVAAAYVTEDATNVHISDTPVEVFLLMFSRLSIAVGAAAIFRRAMFNSNFLKSFLLSVPKMKVLDDPLTFQERESARLSLIRWVQRECLAELREALEKHPTDLPSKYSRVRPYIDATTNIIMAMPRTGEPPLILIPKVSHFSRILVMDIHSKLFHAGTPRVMAEIQRTYWIPQLRSICRRVLGACVNCSRYQCRPYPSPEGALAPFRAEYAPPFAHTGLDFAEYIQITPSKKLYILLFTCAISRALHIEVCPDMKAESVFAAITRFMGRRGPPIAFYSDNAKSFIKLSSMVNVRWTFIPARSPWWGGWWERLVGTVKSALRKTLHLSAS